MSRDWSTSARCLRVVGKQSLVGTKISLDYKIHPLGGAKALPLPPVYKKHAAK